MCCAARLVLLVGCTSVPYEPTIIPSDFVTTIDNPFFPLIPGTTYIYTGTNGEGDEKNEVYITSEMKQILGVTCTIVRDRVFPGV